jgi:hypothetical protein
MTVVQDDVQQRALDAQTAVVFDEAELAEFVHEDLRRFLTHVLPKGLHRVRHYGLFANGHRAANIARARQLRAVPPSPKQPRRSRRR